MSNGWDELFPGVEENGGESDVAAVVAEQAKAAKLTPAQKRQRARDVKRIKRTVDFQDYPELLEAFERVKAVEGTGTTSTMLWLMTEGLKVYRDGKRPRKVMAESLQFTYDMVPDIDALEG
jgi:hypothetical protein